VDDLQKLVNAPEAVKLLKEDLLTIDKALSSLKVISSSQWESLGESVVDQATSAMTLCSGSCGRFSTDLSRWTWHSSDGKLSVQDRVMVGFFKQDQIKDMTITLASMPALAVIWRVTARFTDALMLMRSCAMAQQ
jgi:hypothetical protein